MAAPQLAFLDALLQRHDEVVAQRVTHVPWIVDQQIDRFDFLAYELVDPLEFRGELRIGLEVPRHGAPRVLQ